MHTETHGNVKVVRLGGRLDSTAASTLYELMETLTREGCVNIVLDMKDVRFVSSYGLGVLSSSFKRLGSKGGALTLASMTEEAKVPFELTGILPLFKVFDDCEKAVESYKS